MKYILFSLLFFAVTKFAVAQEYENPVFEADSLKEADSLPSFTFYTVKDSIPFTKKMLRKGLPVLFISFNTDCDHCQHEIESIKKYMDEFKGIQIVMVSRQSRKEVYTFYMAKRIYDYPIIMLFDGGNQLHQFFDFNYIPMIRRYNSKWKRIAAFNQQAPVLRLVENFKKKK